MLVHEQTFLWQNTTFCKDYYRQVHTPYHTVTLNPFAETKFIWNPCKISQRNTPVSLPSQQHHPPFIKNSKCYSAAKLWGDREIDEGAISNSVTEVFLYETFCHQNVYEMLKFSDLPVRLFARLGQFRRVWRRACAIACIILPRLIITMSPYFRPLS